MVEMREVQLEQSISTIVFLFMICEGDVSDVNIKVTLENSDIMLISCLINTHYIHSVVVQNFVSGRVCCVNQYHYKSRRVVMRLVHATDKTWYTVLYHHTMNVISLSNISIKTNFKQIARVELKCIQYSKGDYILCMTSRYFFRSFTNVRLLCFVSHSNGMM